MSKAGLDAVVTALRKENRVVPGFDPANGNEDARALFLLESPGPGAVQSGYVSMDNDDPTARNFRAQVEAEAGLPRRDIALWNIVPWYLGAEDFSKLAKVGRTDIEAGARWLPAVLDAMQALRVVCFVGASAQRGARCVQVDLLKRGIPRVDLWHTSAQAMAGERGQLRWRENVDALRAVGRACQLDA